MNIKHIRAFADLTISEKRDLFYINLLIIKYYLLTKIIPIRYYYNRYFIEPCSQNFDMQLIGPKICFINKVIRHCPIKTNCLIRSLVKKAYFNSYKICIPIYLGIRKEGKLIAHAWNFNKPNDYLQLK